MQLNKKTARQIATLALLLCLLLTPLFLSEILIFGFAEHHLDCDHRACAFACAAACSAVFVSRVLKREVKSLQSASGSRPNAFRVESFISFRRFL